MAMTCLKHLICHIWPQLLQRSPSLCIQSKEIGAALVWD